MAYVDRDPQTLARRKELKKMMRKRNRDDENEQSRIAQLIQATGFLLLVSVVFKFYPTSCFFVSFKVYKKITLAS